ncbi:hypothetical protein NEA10_08175 [Phormidium yuhuli AB48]|uniref:Uncharacterized protein n=1 Tax=Phormidium yuhuli AB48 TaxID=2940671 RepID=A0ABY5AUY5_9CYAN|nr:hypothetical protein [Phormidium yuhuli]USR92680.1 hypothetical protein NEA10_08175 [Phormidium yuhuli AB48]
MIKSRFFLYVAIALLSLSFTVLGYLSLSSYPGIGAILGFIIGGVLSALLARITLTLQDSHKLLTRHLAKRNEQLTRIEQTLNQLESLKLQDTLNTYVDELKNTSQHNQQQKQILDQLSNLYVSLQSGDTQAIRTNQDEKLEVEVQEEQEIIKNLTKQEAETSPQILPGATKSAAKQSQKLSHWLETQNAELLSFESNQSVSSSLKKIALFIEKHYDKLSELMKQIRQSIAGNYEEFNVDLSNKSVQALSVTNNFGDRLTKENMLSYKYYREGGSKFAKVTPLKSKNIKFLISEWLNSSVHQKMTKFFQGKQLKHEAITNANIRLSNGQSSKVDFVFFVANQPLFIKCDVTVSESDIGGYAEFCRNVNLQPHQIYFVSPDVKNKKSNSLTSKHKIQVVNPSQVIEILEKQSQFTKN